MACDLEVIGSGQSMRHQQVKVSLLAFLLAFLLALRWLGRLVPVCTTRVKVWVLRSSIAMTIFYHAGPSHAMFSDITNNHHFHRIRSRSRDTLPVNMHAPAFRTQLGTGMLGGTAQAQGARTPVLSSLHTCTRRCHLSFYLPR